MRFRLTSRQCSARQHKLCNGKIPHRKYKKCECLHHKGKR